VHASLVAGHSTRPMIKHAVSLNTKPQVSTRESDSIELGFCYELLRRALLASDSLIYSLHQSVLESHWWRGHLAFLVASGV
jgi:hypothetical protein